MDNNIPIYLEPGEGIDQNGPAPANILPELIEDTVTGLQLRAALINERFWVVLSVI